MSIEFSARFPSSSNEMKNTRSFDAPNDGSAPFFVTSVALPPAAGTT
jgi:hypothetical protein